MAVTNPPLTPQSVAAAFLVDSLLVSDPGTETSLQRKLILDEWQRMLSIDNGFIQRLRAHCTDCFYSRLLSKLLLETFGKVFKLELQSVTISVTVPASDPLGLILGSENYKQAQVDEHPLLEHVRQRTVGSIGGEEVPLTKKVFRKSRKTVGMDGR